MNDLSAIVEQARIRSPDHGVYRTDTVPRPLLSLVLFPRDEQVVFGN